MKKSLLILTAALTFGMAAAQTEAPASAPQVPTLTDVPAGHWAKDAIDKLVSRGIILGYPDGTFRGTQNLTRYEAAVIIARLLDQIRVEGAPAGMDEETLAALQNAIQELAADLAALGVRVTDLEENAVSRDDFTRLEERVEALASAGGNDAAVADLQAQIDALNGRLDEMGQMPAESESSGDYDTLRADVDDNASSIAALNDLTVLLNQDILDLQDRVSAVEAAQADLVARADFDALSGRVGGIDTRLVTLEKAPKFSVSSAFGVTYGRIALTKGTTNFDVDRLTRQTFADGAFSTGSWWCASGKFAPSGPVNCVDTTNVFSGGWGVFGLKASNLSTTDGKFVINNGAINFYADNFLSGSDGVKINIDNISLDGTLAGQKFDVRYEPYRSSFKLSEYLMANDNDTSGVDTINGQRGIVANIQADQLPFKPKLTIVTGYATPFYSDTTLKGNYWGVRSEMKVGEGTFGVAYGQSDDTGTLGRSGVAADWDTKLGPIGLTGAAAATVPHNWTTFVTAGGQPMNVWQAADKAIYTNATADFGVVKFAANGRAIDPDFANGNASMSANDSAYWNSTRGTMSYGADQIGFGAGLGANLGPIALAAFGDSYTDYAGADRVTSFGVSAGVKLAAFSLKGFYNQTFDADGYIADDGFGYNYYSPYMDVADVPFNYSTNFGGVLKHDGAAKNALIKGLNLTVADIYFFGDKINDLQVYGNYSGNVLGVKFEPFARYHMLTAPTASTASISYNTVKYGVKLSTPALTGVPLQPSLYGNFAHRITNTGSAFGISSSTMQEMFGQAGITFNRFLVNNMKASLGYSYYRGVNVTGLTTASSQSGASATYSAAADRFYRSPGSGAALPYITGFGSNTGSLDGIYTQLDWNGLGLNWGYFRYNDAVTPANSSIAQAFKVSYTFKF